MTTKAASTTAAAASSPMVNGALQPSVPAMVKP